MAAALCFRSGRLWKGVLFIVAWVLLVQVLLLWKSDSGSVLTDLVNGGPEEPSPSFPHQPDSVQSNISHARPWSKIQQTHTPFSTLPHPRRKPKPGCFFVSDSRGEQFNHAEGCPVVLVVPFTWRTALTNTSALSQADESSASLLAAFLDTASDYDGATCLQTDSGALSSSLWCRLARREWSVIIRNTGPEREVTTDSARKYVVQDCNAVQGPLMIRSRVFEKLGWRAQYGKASLLDFYLRSKGKLRIAKLKKCEWSAEITKADRGPKIGLKEFNEYVDFGNEHGILRIIKEDGVEWMGCIANHILCAEKPYAPPTTLPEVALPICCHVGVYTMLYDFAKASDKLGIQYRLIYGTLLGAVRSNAIIPWTHDADVAIDRTAYDDPSTYEKYQKLFGDKYYIGMSHMNMPRMHALHPPRLDVNTTKFFRGPDDLQADAFFSPGIQEAVEGMLPIPAGWRDQPYLDIYFTFDPWIQGSRMVTINNQTFSTIREIDYELTNWYGKNYMEPILRGSWFGMSDNGNVWY